VIHERSGTASPLSSRLLVPVFLLALGVSSCGIKGVRRIEVFPVSASVEQVRVAKLAGDHAMLEIRFAFQNPNRFAVNAEKFRYDVMIGGSVTGVDSSETRFSVDPGDGTRWWGKLRVKGETVQSVAADIIRGKQVEYALKGELTVSKGLLERRFRVSDSGRTGPGGRRSEG